jgi:hypothetical protein
MARSHPSNNPSPTDLGPPGEEEQEDDHDPSSSLQHQVHHQIDTDPPGRHRPSSMASTASASASLAGHNIRDNGSSEGYPSWLPKRPPPPAPGSTLHSLSTTHIFAGSSGAVDPAPTAATTDLGPATSSSAAQTSTIPFIGGRKPTPRSVRIVSMQDSSVAGGAGPGASGGARASASGSRSGGGMIDRMARVSSATISFPFPFPFFSSSLLCRSRERSPSSGRLSPTPFSSFKQTPDARLRAAVADPPRFRATGLHLELLRDPSWKTRLHFYIFPLLVFAHVPLQTFFDFNTVFILIE